MKNLKIVFSIGILSIVFFMACNHPEPPPRDSDKADEDIVDPDADQVKCVYEPGDSKIMPDTYELMIDGQYGQSSSSKYLRIRNFCYPCDPNKKLIISNAEFTQLPGEESRFSFSTNPLDKGSVEVGEGEEITFGVNYLGTTWDAHNEVLKIYSNDRCYPVIDVKVTGVVKPSSHLVLKTPDDANPDDSVMDFGDSIDTKIHRLEVSNNGPLNLKVFSYRFIAGESPNVATPGFFIETPISPTDEIVTGETRTMKVGCRNDKDNPQYLEGFLELNTNDTTIEKTPEGEVIVNSKRIIKLKCGPFNDDAPKAVLECPAEGSVLEWIVADGSKSTDSDGITKEGLQYYWLLSSDTSGVPGMYNNEDKSVPVNNVWTRAEKAAFQPVMRGQYLVRLMVKNTRNIKSNFAECTVDVKSLDDLMVKLTWDNKNSDVDLHLLYPIPGAIFGENSKDPTKNSDCFYFNCSPEGTGTSPSWGGAGETKNDPRLDIDNTTGLGPETVAIREPANGTYKVVIQAFDTYAGPSTAAVKVFTHQSQAASVSLQFPKGIRESDQTKKCWDVLTLDVTDGIDGKKDISVSVIEPSLYDCPRPTLNK